MIQSPYAFNPCFLRTMLKGLRLGGVSSKKMSCRERKKAIELSANIAMAAASTGMNWSHALIARHTRNEKSSALVWRILGRRRHERFQRMARENRARMASCLKRRRGGHDSINGAATRIIAMSLVKKRRRVLERLVPGGECCLDEFSLLGETIDYVISLQAQVNQMRLLAEAVGVPNLGKSVFGG